MKEDKTLHKAIMNSEIMGPVHQACFFPYFDEKRIRILIKARCYSMGDTISISPIVREIRRAYPRAHLCVMTFYPDIYKYNPHINEILDLNQPIQQAMIDSYMFQVDTFSSDKGGHFAMQQVEFVANCTMGRSIYPTEWEYEVLYSQENIDNAIRVTKEAGIDPEKDKVIVFNPHGTEWETRDWGKVYGPELGEWIIKQYPDYKIVSLGGRRDDVPSQTMKNYVQVPGIIELYGKFSILDSIAFLNQPYVKLMITPDTGTLHLAACSTELPIVAIFTVVKSYFRTPVRKQRMGYKFVAVEADDPCSCTYRNRFMTNEMRFDRCPKKEFLESTLRNNIPKEVKIWGLQNYDMSIPWDKEKGLQKQITDELSKFTKPALPCFPKPEKVQRAIERAMNDFVR
jgi:ADP-heptose:LPS heptosyltransferase